MYIDEFENLFIEFLNKIGSRIIKIKHGRMTNTNN